VASGEQEDARREYADGQVRQEYGDEFDPPEKVRSDIECKVPRDVQDNEHGVEREKDDPGDTSKHE
jgi:hypothetical protein